MMYAVLRHEGQIYPSPSVSPFPFPAYVPFPFLLTARSFQPYSVVSFPVLLGCLEAEPQWTRVPGYYQQKILKFNIAI